MSELSLLDQDCAVLQKLWPVSYPVGSNCCELETFPDTCNNGRIAKIDLTDGEGKTKDSAFPKELAALTGLQFIILSNNDYTSIPDGVFDNLSVLETLDLSNNKFADKPIPSSIGNLSSLTALTLSGSGFGGEIPTGLEKLTSLEQLWLYDNNLSGSLPSWISNLQSLKSFDFFNNPLLEGPLPDLAESVQSCTGTDTDVCIPDGHKGIDCGITDNPCFVPTTITTETSTTTTTESSTTESATATDTAPTDSESTTTTETTTTTMTTDAAPTNSATATATTTESATIAATTTTTASEAVAPSATASVAASATTGVSVAVPVTTTTASAASTTAAPASASTTTTVVPVVVAPTTTASAAAVVITTTVAPPVVVVPGATTTVAAVYGQPSAAPSPSPSGGASIYGTGDLPAGEIYTKHPQPGTGEEPILSGAAAMAASVVSVVAALLAPLALF
ncbi:hypothetical protein BC831DRAFT_442103 [Entophlyctis helioformis]|nr:hypothetical protein BC831DRAFT_442103 [Entophlyctis helioformis]